MNKAKFFLLTIAVAAGIGGALAFKVQSHNFSGSKNTIITTETWVSTGYTAQDQNDSHYVPIVGEYTCLDVPVVCVYIKLNGRWVQWERGLFDQ